jgi:hypothetical protein
LVTIATLGFASAASIRDLPRVIHSELDRAVAMRFAHAEQRQRHADIGVQVASRRERPLVAGVRAQDRGENLLGRRLAVGAGDRDDDRREALAPVRAQSPKAVAAFRRRRGSAKAPALRTSRRPSRRPRRARAPHRGKS